MPQISVRQSDGSLDERTVPDGTTAAEVFTDRSIVVARVAGVLTDLSRVVQDGDVLEPVAVDTEDGRSVLRHSTAHVLAQAVQDLFPEAKLGIGPPIRDGFYYDFDVARPFTPEDLAALEKRMQEIVKSGQRFSRRVVTEDAARAELSHEPYKLELIGLKSGSADDSEMADVMEVGGTELTIYDNLDAKTGERSWCDLCRGPHVPTTRVIPAFKLMRSAAAYWRGSEKNPMLQRIYGTAWENRDALKAHLAFLEEAEKRDHRRLGNELDLFSFPEEIGSGLAVFPPRVVSSVGRWRTTPAFATSRLATSSSTARTSPRPRCSRPPVTSSGTPRGCTPRWSSMRSTTRRVRSSAPARSTT